MNENNRNVDDHELRDVFRSVRELEVPTNLRAKCLAAAQDGLVNADAVKPVKHDRTKVPFSAATAASLLVGVGLGWMLHGDTRKTGEDGKAETQTQQTITTTSAGVNATSVIAFEDRDSEESFLTEEIYLCGVGRIQSKVTIFANGESQ